ncbi:MAG: succinylglutamate desuccinylase/aspartoacylase family protein [Planctomycetota bacterium]|jgi:succinylglutamate desuccinylase
MDRTRVCPPPTQRIIGRVGTAEGPALLIVAGVHGNEIAGVGALQRVIERLRRDATPLRGELVALVGNLGAVATGERFREADLNRIWHPERLRRLEEHRGEEALLAEEAELLELRSVIDATIDRSPGRAYFLDLHTTSAASVPFGVVGDTLPNRAFAMHFPVPIILGIEEQVEGTLPEYAYGRGCITMGFEAGQHDDPASVDLHESAVWLALHAAGLLDAAVANLEGYRERLARAAEGVPRFLEVRHRHRVERRESFEMLPGFGNFQAVEAGQLLARDRGAEVRAAESARIFMPLYQSQGDDGFFLARPVRPVWLRLSAVLRRLGLGALAPWLPGVRRHPGRELAVTVDPHVARWYVVEIFHLLGYRQRTAENGRLVFARRAYDVGRRRRNAPPDQASSS